MKQTEEIPILDKEEVSNLNSTSMEITDEPFNVGGTPETSGNIWGHDNTWWGKLGVNEDDTKDFAIISYFIYEDGEALIPGIDFKMHSNSTHGQFRLFHNASGHTYTANYKYFDFTKEVGYLAHGNVIGTETSGDYKVYRNGQSLKINEFDLDEVTGNLTLTSPLGPDEVIEIAYKYYLYVVESRNGELTFSDQFNGTYNITVNYSYYTYTLDMVNGILAFADGLNPGDVIKANYSYVNYTFDMEKGIVKFAKPLLPGETVTCAYWHYNVMIPVFINIGADKPDFTFGGNVDYTPGNYDELFKPNEIIGGFGFGSGDWRYFYMDIEEQGVYDNPEENQRLLVDVEWENDLTDIDVQVFGGRDSIPKVQGDPLPSDRYGPHTIRHVGGSDETANFFTTTGGPEEINAPLISGGINVIALHTVGMNGTEDYTETYKARVGTLYVEPTEVKVSSNELYGDQEIRMLSNMEWEGVGGIAAGPSAPESLENLTVEADDPDWSNYGSFEEQLSTGTTVYSRTIKDCLIFHVHIWGHTDFGYKDVVDLDLGVFLDGSGEDVEDPDGIIQVDEFVAYGADFDADEEVKLIAPPDGTYLIVIYGFTIVTEPAHFDMDITIVQGAGFDLSGKGENILPDDMKGSFSSNQTEDPFNITYLKMSWDLPGSTTGTLQGAVDVGPGNGPMAMLIPIELTIDKDPPVIIEQTSPEDGVIINNNRPLISANIEDLERGEIEGDSIKLIVDGTDVTSVSKIGVSFDGDHAGSGYPSGSVQYIPNAPLSEGGHSVELSVMDWAGNQANKKWAFTVDTKKPVLSLDSISKVAYTNQDTYDIQGTAEADAYVGVMVGAVVIEVKRDAVGGFTAQLDLVDGDNILIVNSTDAAGNEAKLIVTIVMDTEIPTFERLVCLDTTLTNQPNTVISGSISEQGSMVVNGDPSSVNSDGTFDKHVELTEGENVFALEFTDLAGNTEYRWLNVTLDTQAPVINMDLSESSVFTDSVNISGTTEADANIRINGKLVQVESTRQQAGSFSRLVRLSPGQNIIVIEARDAAGNVEELYTTVTYDDTDTGPNYGAIGLMILLLIIGLLIGILVTRMLFGEREPREEEPPVEIEEDITEEPILDDEEAELPEDFDEEPVPDEEPPIDEDIPDEDFVEPVADDDIPSEPIPDEEAIPDEIPEEDVMPEPEMTPEEPEVDLPEEDTPEELADDIVAEGTMEEALEEPEVPVEDEKVLKLKKAFEEGKISEELYEKNLKRLQG
jgi:hypothetical protein